MVNSRRMLLVLSGNISTTPRAKKFIETAIRQGWEIDLYMLNRGDKWFANDKLYLSSNNVTGHYLPFSRKESLYTWLIGALMKEIGEFFTFSSSLLQAMATSKANVSYIGPVDDAKKQQLLGGAKAFLMPIKWEEPFGIVMIEAMACGAPVLAFRRGSVPEVVAKGVGNISSSVEEMASQVAALDCLPPKEINDFVRTNFSRQVIAAQYIDLFRQWTGK